jgi:thiol-disulfide isomerase/thioredoxin
MSSTLDPAAVGADVATLVTAAGLPLCPSPAPAPAVAGGLPDIALDCLGGGDPVRLSALRGPLLINVWASWCGPCQAETPVLSAFADFHGERVPVLGVDVGDTRAGGLAAAARWGATFPSVQDPREVLKGAVRPAYVGPPATYLLRADGTVAPLILGEITQQEQIVAALAAQGVGLSTA